MEGIILSKSQVYDLLKNGRVEDIELSEFDYSNGERFNFSEILGKESKKINFIEVEK